MTRYLPFGLLSLSLILFFNSAWAGIQAPQSAPQNILPNNDFSQLDESGNPLGWSCSCQMEPQVCPVSNDPQSGGKILSLKPGCNLSSKIIPVNNQKQGIHFEVMAKQIPPYLQDLTLQINSAGTTHLFQQTAQPNSSKPVQDAFLLQAEAASSQDASDIRVSINNFHLQEMKIQKIEVLQYGENPSPKSASLLQAMHEHVYTIGVDSKLKEVWIPLPLDYASQVPLWLNLNPTPQSAIHSIRFSADEIGNWGAIVELNPYVAPGTQVHFRWEGLVLNRILNEDETAEVYQDTNNPAEWLQATKTVDSQYQPVANLAGELTKNSTSLLEKIEKISQWEVTHLNKKHPLELVANDATTSYNTLSANCTGYSQLASAMARSIGLPSRTIANYWVDFGAMSTHFINEFYLGPQLGWKRIEPQAGSYYSLAEDTHVTIRINRTGDEGENAYHRDEWVFPGTPYKSVVEHMNGLPEKDEKEPVPDTFPECPDCDNRAQHWMDLRGSHGEMKVLFERARKNWQYDFQAYLKQGKIDAKRQTIREHAPKIKNTADLKNLLDELDALL